MNKHYAIDKDLLILSKVRYKRHYALQRYLMNAFFKTTLVLTKPKSPVLRETITIDRLEDDDLLCYHYYVEGTQGKPLLLYFHGGGFQMEGTFIHQHIIEQFVLEAHIQVLFIKYRLMPEFVYPSANKDAIDSYDYVLKHHQRFQTKTFYVAGDSAGGHIALSLSLYDLESNQNNIKKTLLIYPVISNTAEFSSHNMYTDTPMWNQSLNVSMWKSYLKHTKQPQDADLLRKVYHGLGPVYIETAHFDPLRDEGIALEKLLKVSHVDVKSHHTLHTVHGYDAIPHAKITKKMMQSRIAFLKENI
jgi:acetyl esterase